MYENCECLVLRRVRYSETSYIVTLFTREFGRVDALAKGARRAGNPMLGHFDFLAHEEVTLFRRERSTLDIATAAALCSDYPRMRLRPELFAAGGILAEIILTACPVGEPNRGVFASALNACEELDSGAAPLETLLRTLTGFLPGLGFAPRLDACVQCGAVNPENAVLSPASGGLLCPVCLRQRIIAADNRFFPQLNRGEISTLRHWMASETRVRITDGRSLLRALELYYQYVLARELKSFALFKRLTGNSRQAG